MKVTEPELIIRQGKINDLTEMRKLFMDTIATICTADYDKEQIEVWTSVVENKQHWYDIVARQFVLIAQHADKIVGFVTLDNGNYIDLLYIHKDYQRKGIAQRLLDDISTEARRLRQTILTSDVRKTAKPFFEMTLRF